MGLVDYATEFILYRRVLEKTEFLETKIHWESDGKFLGALVLTRDSENRIPGGAQNFDITEKFTLHILFDADKPNLPVYDDFVRQISSDEFYRIISNPASRITPEQASLTMSVCTVEKTDFPGGALIE